MVSVILYVFYNYINKKSYFEKAVFFVTIWVYSIFVDGSIDDHPNGIRG